MKYEARIVTEKNKWDTFVRNHPYGHLLQSWNWGEFKSPEWKPIRVGIFDEGELTGTAQILSRPFIFGYKFFYIPRGPVVSPNKELFNSLFAAIKEIAEKEKAFVICIEPNFSKNEAKNTFPKGFQEGAAIQPNDTSIIDISQNTKELLLQMHPKSRQYIKKAERFKVSFSENTKGDKLKEFLKIMDFIRERSRVLIHQSSYYRKFWEVFKRDGEVYLVFVKVSGDVDGGSILVGYGNTIYDLYGGPSGLHPETKSSHLLKWRSIEMGKNKGYKLYDQMGLAPSGNTSHHYDGVTVFKERFGGNRVTYAGSLYYPLTPLIFAAWKTVPILRNLIIRVLKKS